MILRRPFSLNTADAATGIVTIHFRVIGRGTDWFTRLRPGDAIDLLGPLGPAVRGGSAQPPPAAGRRRPRAWPGSGCWPTRRSATGAG